MNKIIIIIFFFITFFFTSSEMAFITLNKLLVRVRARKKKSYAILYNLIIKPEIYLYTILVGTNLSIVILSNMTEKEFIHSSNVGNSFYMSLLLTLILLIISEIIPKTITKDKAESFAIVYAPIIKALYYLLFPIIFVSTFFSEIVFRIWKLKSKNFLVPKITKSDLMFLVKDEVKIASDYFENNIIRGIFDFDEKTAKDIMIPRTDIVSIEKNSDFEKIREMFFDNEKVYTRLPVFDEDEDNVIGIVNINDIILNRDKKIEKLMDNDPYYAPENASLENLMIEMKKHNKHMAIIVNEYGGLAGIVTIEDIIEEFLGEISDEYDIDEDYKFDEDKIIIEGTMRIEDINDNFKLNLPVSNYYETIAGFILFKLGYIPTEGIEIKLKTITIRVLKMKENTIELIEIERRNNEENGN